MDRSMMSMIYFVALIALFLILVIATIAVIASRSRRRDEDFEEDDEEEGSGDIFQDAEDMVGDDIYVDNLDMEQNADDADGYDDGQESYEPEDMADTDYADMDYDDNTAYGEDTSYEDDADSDEDAEMLDSAFADVLGAPGDKDALVANAPTQEIDTHAVKEERRSHAAEDVPTLQTERDSVADADMDSAQEQSETDEDVGRVQPETDADTDAGSTRNQTATMADIDVVRTQPDVATEQSRADAAMSDADEQIPSEDVTDRPADSMQGYPGAGADTDVAQGLSGTDTSAVPEQTELNANAAISDADAQPSGRTRKKHTRKKKERPQAVQPASVPVPDEDLTDSAFAPDIPETGLTNEAIAASVREAEAMGAAIMGDLKAAKVPVETMFGINEQLSTYGTKKSRREKSKVSSDEDFYWYNREDVADRPARRPAEVYYHYFNLPAECIDDLLVEMYDGALVRTEEIRYIAYGIEPRTLTMKEIMSGAAEKGMEKKKEPTTQDLVRIYEKWCGYVDQLLDRVVEIHADEYTIQEIRKQLCEYGRGDVDTLLEGR